MKLSDKIRKLFTPAAYQSAGNHIVRWFSMTLPPAVIKALFPLNSVNFLREIDGQEFKEIQRRYGVIKPTSHSPKYISFPLDWLDENVARVKALHLQEGPKKTILDIGCGAGYFLYIAQRLGHRTVGLDLDADPIFNEMIRLLKVDRRVWCIEPFVPLPDFGCNFDTVTAHLTCFDRSETSGLWGIKEWQFFLTDLSRHLNPGAEIFLDINPAHDGSLLSAQLGAYFEKDWQAVLNPNRRGVYIRSKSI